MKTSDFTTTILVDQTPEIAFHAINNPRGWWSEDIEGGTDKLNDEFDYHYEDVHYCHIKLTEVIPNQKVVWLVTDNYFDFTKDKTEWKGTKVVFEISGKDGKTEVKFTHEGLVPAYECYDICHDAWTNYIQGSLRNLIMTGKGEPNPKGGRNSYQDTLSKKMNLSDYHTIILANCTEEQAFKGINDVTNWWTENMEGSNEKLNDGFTVHFGKVYITLKVTELIPDKRIVWYVTDCNKDWLQNKKEWNDTQLIWNISTINNRTQVDFTHKGLVPKLECYDACAGAWDGYVKDSLLSLMNTGKGQPDPKEVVVAAAAE